MDVRDWGPFCEGAKADLNFLMGHGWHKMSEVHKLSMLGAWGMKSVNGTGEMGTWHIK